MQTLKDLLTALALASLAFAVLYLFLLVTAPCGSYEPASDCNITNNQ